MYAGWKRLRGDTVHKGKVSCSFVCYFENASLFT